MGSVIFGIWKAVLLLLALASPGPGYDTSTTLLDWPERYTLLSKLVRWDSIYFTQIAQHGHLFEQEWAWGTGITSVLAWGSRLLFATSSPSTWQITVSGLLLSHLTSWMSMMLVWLISAHLAVGTSDAKAQVAFVAALLYIVSPAGIFLSAPYSESLFAALNLLGFHLFLLGRNGHARGATARAALMTVCGGLASGLATAVRSNGILSGMLYGWDASLSLLALLDQGLRTQQVTRLLSLIVGGCAVGAGMMLPQYQGYVEYCTGHMESELRPWCKNTIPSIFTFVQSHYWNVGAFR